MTEAEKIKKLCEVIKRQNAEILYWKDSVRMLSVLMGAKENEMGKIITEHDNYVRSKTIKEFAERLCKDRVSNDPIVIAVKVELEAMVGDKDDKT